MRPAPRLFVKEGLGEGSFTLGQAQARYLGQVLRLAPGDAVRLFNGRDGEWLYTLGEIGKRGGTAEPLRQRRAQPISLKAPILLFAPIKRTQTELLIQKGTELGTVRFQPIITARTNRDTLRLDRLETIAEEAAEQSERLSVPSIAGPMPLAEALRPLTSFIFCDEAGDDLTQPWGGNEGRAGQAGQMFERQEDVPMVIVIGPEGGFTPDERACLRANPSALPVSLGPRILRAETAAIVALTLWQAHFGDLASPSV